MSLRTVIGACCGLFAGLLGSPVNAAEISPDEARAIGTYAAIYGMAPSELDRLRSTLKLNTGEAGSTPANTFLHIRTLFPAGTPTCCPNQDTLYSLAWVDVSHGPLVLIVPRVANRYATIMIADAYTNNVKTVDAALVPAGGGKFLLAGPNWNGKSPNGYSLIRMPTNEGFALARVYVAGKADYLNGNAVQDKFTLKLQDPSVGAPAADPKYDGSNPLEVYRRLSLTLVRNPVLPGEEGLLTLFKRIGIDGQHPFNEPSLSSAVIDALKAAAREAETLTAAAKPTMSRDINGWQLMPAGDAFGNNYLKRAVVARYFILTNNREHSVYFNAETDAQDRPLTSSHTYRLRFAGPVPAGAFWSVIAYSKPNSYLEKNSFEKYVINNNTPGLVVAANGGFEITFGTAKPAQNEANWLPVPAGEFLVSMRIYRPKKEVLRGTYAPPRLEVIN